MHVAATRDHQTGETVLYIDGQERDRQIIAAGQTLSATAQPIRLGREFGDRAFNGDLNDVFIYDRALTPAEIGALYTGYRDCTRRALPVAQFTDVLGGSPRRPVRGRKWPDANCDGQPDGAATECSNYEWDAHGRRTLATVDVACDGAQLVCLRDA